MSDLISDLPRPLLVAWALIGMLLVAAVIHSERNRP